MHGRLEASSQLVTHRRSTYWLLTVKELNECCIPYNTCTVTPVYFSYYFLTGTCTVPVRDGCEVRLCDPFPAPPGVFLPVQYRCSTGKQSMKPSTRAPLLLPVTTFYRYGTGTVGPTVQYQNTSSSTLVGSRRSSGVISIQATAGALFPSS